MDMTYDPGQKNKVYESIHPATHILDMAKSVISLDRRADYGPAVKSCKDIADMWSLIMQKKVSSRQVALMMIALKVIRETHRHKDDNLIDICGYAALIADLVPEPEESDL
jgi:hypothetical protein